MKKTHYSIALIFILMFSAQNIFAHLAPNTSTNLYQHMVEINKEWLHQDQSNFKDFMRFETDKERIQQHLFLVIDILANKDNSQRTASQLANRTHLLKELKAYAEAGVFPINRYHSTRTPYFIDHRDVHCAVGYMIQQSGHGDIAESIRQTQNYAFIRDIPTGILDDWAHEFGFDRNELAWIQPAYSAPQPFVPVGQGIDGNVHHLASVSGGNQVYVAGSFDQFGDETPSAGFAYFDQNEQLMNIPFTGTIHSLEPMDANSVVLSGSFEHMGTTYNQATCVGQTMNYSYAGDDAQFNGNSTLLAEVDGTKLVHVFDAGTQQEVTFSSLNGTNTEHVLTVFGSVSDYQLIGGKSIIAGDFDSVWVHSPGGPTTLMTKNLVVQDGDWTAFDGPVPGKINSVAELNGLVYLAGQKSMDNHAVFMSKLDFSAGAITKALHDSLTGTFGQPIEILTLSEYGNASLWMTGNFVLQGVSMTIARNFGFYSEYQTGGQTYPIVEGVGSLNGIVYDVEVKNDQLYVGGSFSGSVGGEPTGQLVKLDGTMGIQSEQAASLKMSPNPASDKVILELPHTASFEEVTVVDLSGKVIFRSKLVDSANLVTLDIHTYPKGTYLVKVSTDSGMLTRKLVVE